MLRVAKTAVQKDDMLQATLLAFWALRDSRPAFATRVSWLVSGTNRDNHIRHLALEPLLKALGLLAEMEEPKSGQNWTFRNYFDQHIKTVEERADILQKLWGRSHAVPMGFAMWCGRASFGILLALVAVDLVLAATR
jgi:hypothetical protein